MRGFLKLIGAITLIGVCAVALKKVGEKINKWSSDVCVALGLKKKPVHA